MQLYRWALIFFCAGLFACTPDIDEDNIPGTWQVIEFNANLPDLSEEHRAHSEKIALSITYQFTTDSTVIYFIKETNGTGRGTWEYSPFAQQLDIHRGVGDEKISEEYLVTEISERYMRWVQNINDEGIVTLVLEKLD